MGGDGIIGNAVVEGNIIHDNGYGGGSAINMDGVQDSEIFNNLIYNCTSAGISVQNQCDALIFNNTIFNCQRGIRFFETADNYRDMQTMLSTALKGIPRDTYQIMSKVTTRNGVDPRQKFESFSFQQGVEKMEDLKPGMKLPGIVTNVTAFGAFGLVFSKIEATRSVWVSATMLPSESAAQK